jgi:hypothetical protein
MNGKQIKRLRRIANELPVVMEMRPCVMTGAELIKQGVKTTLDPEEHYRTEQPFPTNHLERVKQSFITGGNKEVEVYCAYVRKVAGGEDKPVEPDFPKWFSPDNVHEVGRGIIHYTEDSNGDVRGFREVEKTITRYINSGEYCVVDWMWDEKVRVMLYILNKKGK